MKRYLKKARRYRFRGLELIIYPSVFHPKYFFSTGVLIDFLDKLNLENKKFCEVGAGSGLLSFIACKQKAEVVCFDLNQTAVKGIEENFTCNFQPSALFKVYHSDLFDAVPKQFFDVVFINPPYFFKKAEDINSLAWNCGENGEYFNKLFSQLPAYCNYESEIYMILADNCEVEKIMSMANNHNIKLVTVSERKIKWEKNFIFKLNLNGAKTG